MFHHVAYDMKSDQVQCELFARKTFTILFRSALKGLNNVSLSDAHSMNSRKTSWMGLFSVLLDKRTFVNLMTFPEVNIAVVIQSPHVRLK